MIYLEIKKEIISAMKVRNSDRLLALRSLDSAIKNLAIERNHREEIPDEDVLDALGKMCKRTSDSIESYISANRSDLAEVESYQLSVYKEFLPKQLSSDEVSDKLKVIIEKYLEGSDRKLDNKDFGKIMKLVSTELKGLTDNKTISEEIKKLIG